MQPLLKRQKLNTILFLCRSEHRNVIIGSCLIWLSLTTYLAQVNDDPTFFWMLIQLYWTHQPIAF